MKCTMMYRVVVLGFRPNNSSTFSSSVFFFVETPNLKKGTAATATLPILQNNEIQRPAPPRSKPHKPKRKRNPNGKK